MLDSQKQSLVHPVVDPGYQQRTLFKVPNNEFPCSSYAFCITEKCMDNLSTSHTTADFIMYPIVHSINGRVSLCKHVRNWKSLYNHLLQAWILCP